MAKRDSEKKRDAIVAEQKLGSQVERRGFLKGLVQIGATSAAATAAATTSGCEDGAFQDFFKTHYSRMTAEHKRGLFERIAKKTEETYGKKVNLKDPRPIPGVGFVYALDLNKCNGSRLCVTACMKENNQSRDPQVAYIKVLEMNRGSLNLEEGEQYYEGEKVPKAGKFYMPVQCNQCDNPPCTKACPVEATWKEEDGIVVIDYDWCIGCRYCMAACPYEARSFNWTKPTLPKADLNPNQGYLSNRVRPQGVVEKCHFCLHRTREGHYPACLEACPTGARKFGNIHDPKSEIAEIIRTKPVFVLKEELNTMPRFYYYFG